MTLWRWIAAATLDRLLRLGPLLEDGPCLLGGRQEGHPPLPFGHPAAHRGLLPPRARHPLTPGGPEQ